MSEVSNAAAVARNLAVPLAEYLARHHISHPLHATVCAEIYDVVNEIRDKEIVRLKGLLTSGSISEELKASIHKKIAFYEGR